MNWDPGASKVTNVTYNLNSVGPDGTGTFAAVEIELGTIIVETHTIGAVARRTRTLGPSGHRSPHDGLGDGGLNLLFPTLGTQSTLSRVEVYGFYHSGWGSLIGLAVGASFMLRRFRWAPLIAIAAFVVVVFDRSTVTACASRSP